MSFLFPDSSLTSSPTDSVGVLTRQQRKRVLSETEDEPIERKRPRASSRLSTMFARLSGRVPRPSSEYPGDRMPNISREDGDFFNNPNASPRRPRLLSASASFSGYSAYSESSFSRAPSVSSLPDGPMSLIRSASVSSLSEHRPPPPPPPVAESATFHLRAGKSTIDFSVAEADWKSGVCPVGWSEQNIMVFGRGNRVHYKNMTASDDVVQLCKMREDYGNLRLVQCGGKEQPNIVALCTSKGHVQVWDLIAKKMTAHWSSKPITAMAWNGSVLTVGGQRGTIRHFDTRIKETAKMKEQSKRVTRHQAQICSLAWHGEGKFFASGDESGIVHVWDSRQNAPLDVGELIQRRRKMQHVGAVTALTWCPWQSKILASGDSAPDGSGTIRIWNINSSTAFQASSHPTKMELDAQITSLHFSIHCKELLSTHGPGKDSPAITPTLQLDSHTFPAESRPSRIANSVVVHAFPSMRRLVAVSAANANVAGSVMSPNGLRVALAVPEESKLKVWEVWGKRKELRRTSSMLSSSTIR